MPRLTRAAFAAALVAIAVTTAGPDTSAKDKQAKAPAKDKAAKAEAKLKEAEVLKNAYVLMAMADHDYDGHRVKAMGHAGHAQRTLDHQAAKSGTPAQKAIASQQEITDAR